MPQTSIPILQKRRFALNAAVTGQEQANTRMQLKSCGPLSDSLQSTQSTAIILAFRYKPKATMRRQPQFMADASRSIAELTLRGAILGSSWPNPEIPRTL